MGTGDEAAGEVVVAPMAEIHLPGVLAGFVLGSMTFEQRDDWGYLVWIAVASRARGHGVAGRLVSACCDLLVAAGAAAVITDVETRNEASTALMRGRGFEVGATVNLLVRYTDGRHPQPPRGVARPGRNSPAIGA